MRAPSSNLARPSHPVALALALANGISLRYHSKNSEGDTVIIRSFKDSATESVFNGKCPKGFPGDIFKTARRKLEAVNAASTLNDLGLAKGNRLEALKGDREGQYSIRINDQWRICFRWTKEGPTEVEIVDYH